MSVINTMLQDLELRNAGTGVSGAYRYVRPLPAGRVDGRARAVWIGAGAGLVLVCAAAAVWMQGRWAARIGYPSTITARASVPPAAPVPEALPAVSSPGSPPISTATGLPQVSQGLMLTASQQLVLRDVPAASAQPGPAALLVLPSPPPAAAIAAPSVSPMERQVNRAERLPVEKPDRVVRAPVVERALLGRASVEPSGNPVMRDAGGGSSAPPALAAKITPALSAVRPPAPPATAADLAGIKQMDPQQQTENAFRQANEFLQQGDANRAMDGFARVLAQDPLHDSARQALLTLLLRAKKNPDAERLLGERLTLAPNHASFAITLSRLQADRGDTAMAIETLRATLPSVRANAAYHATLAALLARREQHAEAITQYQAALRLAPQAGIWWMGLGLSLQANGNVPDAREALRRARASGDLSPEIAAYVDQRLKQLQ